MTKWWISIALMAFAVAVLLFAILRLISAAQGQPVTCFTTKDQAVIRELTARAIDQAFEAHVAKLFSVWITDFTPEPERARVGMANGISAWQRAHAMKWNPATCKE